MLMQKSHFKDYCLPDVVKVLFVLVSVKDGEGQHPACDDLCLLQQLVEMHHGIICKTAITEMSLRPS